MADLFEPDGSRPKRGNARQQRAAAALAPHKDYYWILPSSEGRELFEAGRYHQLAERLQGVARWGVTCDLEIAIVGIAAGIAFDLAVVLLVVIGYVLFASVQRARRVQRDAEWALDVLDGETAYPDAFAKLAATTDAVETERRSGGQLTYITFRAPRDQNASTRWAGTTYATGELIERLRAHPSWSEGAPGAFWRTGLKLDTTERMVVASVFPFAGLFFLVDSLSLSLTALTFALFLLLDEVDRQWATFSYWYELGWDRRSRPEVARGVWWGKVFLLAVALIAIMAR